MAEVHLDRDEASARRARMVAEQLIARGIRDDRVLTAMMAVPRHELVPPDMVGHAYEDTPLPIGGGKTISQPYVVALMTELLEVGPGARILEIGTGSGYQSAVLAEIGCEVYSIEIDRALGERAARDLGRLGYRVHTRLGDGYRGWPEAAPFDGVIVTAAPPHVPDALREQLAIGARLVIPVGGQRQELLVVTRAGRDEFLEEEVTAVTFVPMTGEAQLPRRLYH